MEWKKMLGIIENYYTLTIELNNDLGLCAQAENCSKLHTENLFELILNRKAL